MAKFVKCSLWRQDSSGKIRKYFEIPGWDLYLVNVNELKVSNITFGVDRLDSGCDAILNCQNPLIGYGEYLFIREYDNKEEVYIFESNLEVEYDFDFWEVIFKWSNTRKAATYTERKGLVWKIKEFWGKLNEKG